jgi:hypothetical protein
VDLNTAVINAYEGARDRGEPRSEAFCRAVHVYRARRPYLPASRAGTEVARILLAAAQTEQAAARNSLPATEEMEYVEPV